MEIDRRKRIIEEIGGVAPGNDTLVGILWVAMDGPTRSHVSGKLDVAEVLYVDLREAVLKHAGLVGATSQQRSATSMDVSATAEAGGEKAEQEEWPA